MEQVYDTIIIGSGPAGLSAAVYAKRAMLEVAVIEKKGFSGGQIINTADVDNYLGMQGISGFEMAMKFREHAEYFGTEFVDGEVCSIDKADAIFEVKLKNGQNFRTKTVILAMGAEHSQLNVPGEKEYAGKGVSYCATCDGAFYRDKTVAVVGGGDVALEDALYLSKLAKKVYLVHRRDELRGAKSLQNKIFAAENIEFQKDSVVSEITGDDMVRGVNVQNIKDGSNSTLEVSGIFIAVGMKPYTEFVKGVADMDQKGYICANEDGITSCPGIFVAGDARSKKLRQIITAVSDGANCVTSVEEYLNHMM